MLWALFEMCVQRANEKRSREVRQLRALEQIAAELRTHNEIVDPWNYGAPAPSQEQKK